MIKNLFSQTSILNLFAFAFVVFATSVNAQNIPANTRMVQLNTVKGSVLSLVESSDNYVYHLGTSNSGEVGLDGLSTNAVGLDDLFILKTDASTGANVWLKSFNAGNDGIITPRYVSIDSSDNLYVYGQFTGTITAGGRSVTATDASPSFIMKVSSDGTAKWVNLLAGGNNTTYPKVKCTTDGTDTFIVYNQNHLARIKDSDGTIVYDNIYSGAELKSVALIGSSLFVAGSAISNAVFNSEFIPVGNGFIVKGDKNAVFSASAVASVISEPSYYGQWADVSDIAAAPDGSLLITGFSKGEMKILLQGNTHNYSSNPNGSIDNGKIYYYFAKITPNFSDVAPFKVSSAVSTDAIYGIQTRIIHSKIKTYGTEGNFRILYTNNHFDNRNTITSFINANGTSTDLMAAGTGNSYKVSLAFNAYGGFSNGMQPQTNATLSSSTTSYFISSQASRLFKTLAYNATSGAPLWSKEKTTSISGTLSNHFQQHLNSAKNDIIVTSVVEGKANFFSKPVTNVSGVSSRYVTRLGINGLPKWFAGFHPDSGVRELNYSSDFACLDKDDNFIFVANTSGASSTFTDAAGNSVDFTQNTAISSKVLIKLDKDGNLVWSKQILPALAANIQASVSVDGNNEVHVMGVTNQSFTIDGTTVTSSGPNSIFMLKFSAAGNLVYAKSYENMGAYTIHPAFDTEDNLFVFMEPINTLDSDYVFDQVTLPSNPDRIDHLMLKFNNSGHAVFGKNFYAALPQGSNGYAWPNDVAFDGSDFILMGIYYKWSNTSFLNGLDMVEIPTVYSSETLVPFFAKIKTDGSVLWQKPFHLNQGTTGSYTNIGIDDVQNIYMHWHLKDKMNVNGAEYSFDPSAGNKVLTKIDTDGNLKYNRVVDVNMSSSSIIDVIGNDKVNISGFTSSKNILSYPVNNNRASNLFIATFGNLDSYYLTPTKEYLELNNIEMTNNPENANTFSFDLINNVNWTANSDQSWLNLSFESLTGKFDFKNLITGNGDAKIIMSAQTNNTGSSRTANMMVSGDSGVDPKTIAITQTAVLANGETKTFVTTLYPNPTSDILNIETKQKISKIEIFDMNGRLLKTADGREKKVSVSQLNKGLYIILLHTENGVVNSKFIKS